MALSQFIFYGSFFLIPFLIFFIIKLLNGHKKTAFALIIFLLFFNYIRFIEPYLLITKTFSVESGSVATPNDSSIKIAVVSDFHIGSYTKKRFLKKTVEKINALNPDIVILPGDFVLQLPVNKINGELLPLKDLQSPTFAVIGNHDAGFPGTDVSAEIKKVLQDFNIKVLDNKIENINIKQKNIALIGLSELRAGNSDYSLAQKAEGDFKILISHNPDSVFNVKTKSVDLAVAGHTHGGQVKIPYIYKHIIPTKNDFVEGFYTVNGINTFITSGIGTVGLPVRFLTIPEIAILQISN